MPKKAASARKAKTATAKRAPVRRYAVRGKGGYFDNLKKRWAEGGGSMKRQFEDAGAILGGPVGRQLGGLLNRAVYAVTGFGDYSVRHNVLLETNGPPVVSNHGKEFIVRHREYIGDIYSSGEQRILHLPLLTRYFL